MRRHTSYWGDGAAPRLALSVNRPGIIPRRNTQGLALDWPRYSNGTFAAEQGNAKAAHRGIWQGRFDQPWDCRAANADKVETVSERSTGFGLLRLSLRSWTPRKTWQSRPHFDSLRLVICTEALDA
ncbi:hypothetical protein NKH42_31010, partial [Mesorhizobium sp. M1142]